MNLVQHCANNSEYSTCYLHQSCVVVSQQCHRIASFLRLVLSQISGTVFHCYLGNAVLVRKRGSYIFSQGLTVFCGGAADEFFKYLIKITCVIKTDGTGDLGD